MSAHPIGVFDSGVGGLSVLHALKSTLPQENFIYLGDTARLPYGSKTAETIQKYAIQAASCLVQRDIKLLVVACNTASAVALCVLQEAFYPLPVIGVVTPTVLACAQINPQKIAVLATERTVKQGAYRKAISAHLNDAQIEELACPLLIALAEEGWHKGHIVDEILKKILAPIFEVYEEGPDCWILGCTHFPIFEPSLRNLVGDYPSIIHSGVETAKAVKEILTLENILNTNEKIGDIQFLVTDGEERFLRVSKIFLPEEAVSEVQVVAI